MKRHGLDLNTASRTTQIYDGGRERNVKEETVHSSHVSSSRCSSAIEASPGPLSRSFKCRWGRPKGPNDDLTQQMYIVVRSFCFLRMSYILLTHHLQLNKLSGESVYAMISSIDRIGGFEQH